MKVDLGLGDHRTLTTLPSSHFALACSTLLSSKWAPIVSLEDEEVELTAVEVFKFATYLFIPLFAMLHFGDPDW